MKKRKKLQGRPVEGSQNLPVYNSQKACEVATGIPVEVQGAAKAGGCEAFRYARVYLGELLPFIFRRSEPIRAAMAVLGITENSQGELPLDIPSASHRAEFDKWRAAREKRRFMLDSQLLVPKAEVGQGLIGIMAVMFGTLDRLFCSEMPPELVGLDELEIRSRSKKAIEDMKIQLRARFEQMMSEGNQNKDAKQN